MTLQLGVGRADSPRCVRFVCTIRRLVATGGHTVAACFCSDPYFVNAQSCFSVCRQTTLLERLCIELLDIGPQSRRTLAHNRLSSNILGNILISGTGWGMNLIGVMTPMKTSAQLRSGVLVEGTSKYVFHTAIKVVSWRAKCALSQYAG